MNQYKPYSEFFFEIYDAILARIRSDPVVGNYGFSEYQLTGDGRFPEGDCLPLVRLVPDMDNIQRLETCTRNHFLECEVRIYEYKPDCGENAYRSHVRIAGAVYDIFSRRDNTDPTLGGLVEEMQIRMVKPKVYNGSDGVNFVSVMQMSILAIKGDE